MPDLVRAKNTSAKTLFLAEGPLKPGEEGDVRPAELSTLYQYLEEVKDVKSDPKPAAVPAAHKPAAAPAKPAVGKPNPGAKPGAAKG